MRYKMSAKLLWQVCIADADGKAISISTDPFVGRSHDSIYHAYPRFLLRWFNEQLRENLYLPWEQVEGFEPLYVHIANTHHWRLNEVRQMKLEEDELLNFLRPELRHLTLEQAVIDAVLQESGDALPREVKADLLRRLGNALSTPEKSLQ